MDRHSSYRSLNDEEEEYQSVHCDMIVFLSVLPLVGITREALSLYEDEMRYPTGLTVANPPAAELSGVMYSPDCETALEWRDERAVKVERFWHAGRTVAIVAAMIAGIQVWWVLKEMGERGSPSVRPPLHQRLL